MWSQPARFGRPARVITRTAAALLVALGLCGCSRLPLVGKYFRREAAANGPLEISLQLAKAVVRPGEALIASVWVRNNGKRPLDIQMIDASAIEFFCAGPDGVTVAHPVVSTREPLGLLETIGPGRYLPTQAARAFVFTTLSDRPGTHSLQASYHPAPKGKPSELAPVYSKAAPFRVEGPVAYRRDRDGILLREDAIGIARRHVKRPVAGAEALLLENARGFLVWAVALTLDPKEIKPGEVARQIVYINPYVVAIMTRPEVLPVPPAKTGATPPVPPAKTGVAPLSPPAKTSPTPPAPPKAE